MPPKPCKLPVQPPSGRPRPQSGRGHSNHKDDKLQLWKVENMRNALVLYFSQRAPGFTGKPFGYKCIADAYKIPRETFRRRIKGPLRGLFGHIAGGRLHFMSVGAC